MTKLFPLVACSIVLSALSARAVAAADPPAPPPGRFTDVTDSSGVAALVARHYEAVPKWWLSGMTLVDLDGDGALDLHLASHGLGPAMAAANDGKGRFLYIDPKLAIPRGPKERADLPYPG